MPNYYFKIIQAKSAEELEESLTEYMEGRPKTQHLVPPVTFNVVAGVWRALITIIQDK